LEESMGSDWEGGNGKSYNDTLLNWISILSMNIYGVWVVVTARAMDW
jgi:hypothetical protein